MVGPKRLDTLIAFDIISFAVEANTFLSSSTAEHSAVNRRVVGSSPT